MIYAALASVVADIRRRKLRSMLPFLSQELVAHSETFEDKMNSEGVDVQLNHNDMEALTMVTFAYSCLASLLIAIVLVRILLAHHSVNFFVTKGKH